MNENDDSELLKLVTDEALEKEVVRREYARAIDAFGFQEVPPDVLARHIAIIEKKNGHVAHALGPFTVRVIRDVRDYGEDHGIGFQISIGESHTLQAIRFLPKMSRGAKDSAVAALARYLQNPDERLVVKGPLYRNELPLVINADGSVSIQPIA